MWGWTTTVPTVGRSGSRRSGRGRLALERGRETVPVADLPRAIEPEIQRARRYRRCVSLVLLTDGAPPAPDAPELRATDEVLVDRDGRTWILAPETDHVGARKLADRLAAGEEPVRVATFPTDAITGRALVALVRSTAEDRAEGSAVHQAS